MNFIDWVFILFFIYCLYGLMFGTVALFISIEDVKEYWKSERLGLILATGISYAFWPILVYGKLTNWHYNDYT